MPQIKILAIQSQGPIWSAADMQNVLHNPSITDVQLNCMKYGWDNPSVVQWPQCTLCDIRGVRGRQELVYRIDQQEIYNQVGWRMQAVSNHTPTWRQRLVAYNGGSDHVAENEFIFFPGATHNYCILCCCLWPIFDQNVHCVPNLKMNFKFSIYLGL